jgi:glycosyltransferase involved in cell wall biosynthesis
MSPPCELSAVVMCFNEKASIASCLDALSFCDEIVVVDDVSTDGTWEYLQTRGDIRAFQNRHTTFAAQREFGKNKASGKWILTMDADEQVSPELAKAIRGAIARPEAPDGFWLQWKNLYPRTLTGASYEWNARLIRADKCRWQNTDNPHSPLDLRGVRLERLAGGHVVHAAPPHYAFLLRKMINRSVITSAQARASGRKTSAFGLLLSTLARFLKAYFKGGAWRHGSSGVLMACLWAFEAFTKHAFLLEAAKVAPESLQDGGPGSYPEGTALVVRDSPSKRA